jgi:hypothetical protein
MRSCGFIGTKFKPGTSGNPKGRAKGCLNRATLVVQSLLDGEAESLTRKAIELALQGDLTAPKICLDRINPPQKSPYHWLNVFMTF